MTVQRVEEGGGSDSSFSANLPPTRLTPAKPRLIEERISHQLSRLIEFKSLEITKILQPRGGYNFETNVAINYQNVSKTHS